MPRLATPPPTPRSVRDACAQLALPCDDNLAEKLTHYLSMLQKWNMRMNLVGPLHWQRMLAELAADSWHLADFLRTLPLPGAPRCMDLGAGAGLPGIPLRMLWQQGSYTLVEVRAKRAMFMQQALANLRLPGVAVFEGRAEEALAREAPLDLIVSRAFMPWLRLLELVTPFCAANGFVVFMANDPPPSSLPQGWLLHSHKVYTAGGKQRHFWAIAAAG